MLTYFTIDTSNERKVRFTIQKQNVDIHFNKRDKVMLLIFGGEISLQSQM